MDIPPDLPAISVAQAATELAPDVYKQMVTQGTLAATIENTTNLGPLTKGEEYFVVPASKASLR